MSLIAFTALRPDGTFVTGVTGNADQIPAILEQQGVTVPPATLRTIPIPDDVCLAVAADVATARGDHATARTLRQWIREEPHG